MPKILMLTTDRMIDRRILLESDALAADGWEVTVLAMPGAQSDHPRVARSEVSHSPAPANRETAIFSAYRLLRQHVSMNGALGRRLKSLIWRHLISPDEFARRLMLPSALRHPCDVVVAHDLPILPAAAEAAKHHGAKLVYDSRELYCEQEFEPAVQRMWSGIERRVIGACDAVITVNPSIAAEMMQRYGLARVGVVQNAERAEGPPPAKGRLFHRAFCLDADAIIVLFQGGLLAGRIHSRDRSPRAFVRETPYAPAIPNCRRNTSPGINEQTPGTKLPRSRNPGVLSNAAKDQPMNGRWKFLNQNSTERRI